MKHKGFIFIFWQSSTPRFCLIRVYAALFRSSGSMESVVGFEEEIIAVDDMEQPSSSDGYKLVPWLSWDEWEFVRESLFSSSAAQVASALERISTWRSRGCIPAAVDITASIIEIQEKDGFISREEQPVDALYSEHLLQMLYCMAVVRLVNCVIERTRKKMAVSIAEAAEAIGIPRTLIDLRHEGSHREVPALSVLQESADKALDWLKSYYWEPQKKQIPFKKDGTGNIRRDIKSRLCELAFCLKEKQSPQLGSSSFKGKGYNKRIRKTLKIVLQLYSSFSSEVVSVLLELLLKALDSSNRAGLPKDSQVGQNVHILLDDWKLVITKFSNKEPELLLTLLQAVLDMVGTQEQMKYQTEGHLTSEYKTEASLVECLSSLFAWLVGHLKGLEHFHQNDSSRKEVSNAIPTEFLCKCLLLSASGNDQLMDSSMQLLELMGDRVCKEKLKNLSSIRMSSTDVTEENSSLMIHETLKQQEESIHDAAKKLEFVKLHRMKSKAMKTKDVDKGNSNRWAKAKTWNPCPIGMLPRVLGSSGRFPVLDCDDDHKKVLDFSRTEGSWELKRCGGKREASCDIQQLDSSSIKKARETVEHFESNGNDISSVEGVIGDIQLLDGSSVKVRESIENCESNGQDISSMDGVRGRLVIGGAWKKVGNEELLAIESAVRILV